MRLGAGGGGIRALEAERFASAVEGWEEDMLVGGELPSVGCGGVGMRRLCCFQVSSVE